MRIAAGNTPAGASVGRQSGIMEKQPKLAAPHSASNPNLDVNTDGRSATEVLLATKVLRHKQTRVGCVCLVTLNCCKVASYVLF